MKVVSGLILLSMFSCGSKNNIFYDASKEIGKSIGNILPAEASPDFKIDKPIAQSIHGQFVNLSGECENTTSLELTNSLIKDNPLTIACTDNTFSKRIEFTNTVDIITNLDIKAINKEKTTEKTVEIEVKVEKPTRATHIDVSFIKSNEVELNWNSSQSNDLPFKGYELEYKKSAESEWTMASSALIKTESATISALDSNTDYDFRVRAFNGNYSVYSSTQDTTKPNIPFFVSDKIKAINIGGSTASALVAIEAGDFYLNGNLLATLTRGQTHNFNSNLFDRVSSDKAFFIAGRLGSGAANKKGNIVWTTQDWSGKKFNFSVSRSPKHILTIAAFEAATVKVFKGSTEIKTIQVQADQGIDIDLTQNGSYSIESTSAIGAFIKSSRNGSFIEDPRPLLPASTDILGYPSRSGYISSTKTNAQVEGVHSNDSLESFSIATSDTVKQIASKGESTSYKGEALRLQSNIPIVGMSNADRNGYCAAPFIPRARMRNTYAVNVESTWVAFTSAQKGTITVMNNDGTSSQVSLIKTGVRSNAPYKARLENIAAGTIFTSTVPMGGWYEPKTDNFGSKEDETIMFGFNL